MKTTNKGYEVSYNFWPTYADLIITLLFIVILYFILQALKSNYETKFSLKTMQRWQQEFYDTLKVKWPDKIGKDSTNGNIQTITFRAELLFEEGEYKKFRSNESETLIEDFAIILKEFAKSHKIVKCTIEGHTNSNGYLHQGGNWNLGALRAQKIIEIFDKNNLRSSFPNFNEKKPSREISISSFAENDFVPYQDGTENKDESKRIQFTLEYSIPQKGVTFR